VYQKLDQSEAIEHILVHTGQNYDYELNELFFEDLGFRKPDYFLNAAGGNATTTAGNVWLSRNQLAELFATSKQNISLHIINILKDGELEPNSVVKDYMTTAADGKNYQVIFYSLEMILAIGFRVRSIRGTQFRQWANRNLKEYLVKGFVMDDERLKNPDGRPDYFEN